jgi:hypothetical protein
MGGGVSSLVMIDIGAEGESIDRGQCACRQKTPGRRGS